MRRQGALAEERRPDVLLGAGGLDERLGRGAQGEANEDVLSVMFHADGARMSKMDSVIWHPPILPSLHDT